MNSGERKADYDVIIAGGGLAGLVSAILYARSKKKVLLIEKKSYPYHKVCGEYVSNEVLGFLQSLGFDPFRHGASRINRLRISSPRGKNYFCNLDLGGFGLSRYVMDESLFRLAIKAGAEVMQSTRVTGIQHREETFAVEINNSEVIHSSFVIGSYGKRDSLDKKLERPFIRSHTGFMGVKYHIKTSYPVNEIGLDNFRNGYCGISKIEGDNYNLCYLFNRNGTDFSSISELEEQVLFQNPTLKKLFEQSDFVYDQPLVINEISFAPKEKVAGHVLMCGDTAGLITPVCGNGMSMAIHSAKMLYSLIINSGLLDQKVITMKDRLRIEKEYIHEWKKHFAMRLFFGRSLQHIFGNPFFTGAGLKLIHSVPAFEQWLISGTHGRELA